MRPAASAPSPTIRSAPFLTGSTARPTARRPSSPPMSACPSSPPPLPAPRRWRWNMAPSASCRSRPTAPSRRSANPAITGSTPRAAPSPSPLRRVAAFPRRPATAGVRPSRSRRCADHALPRMAISPLLPRPPAHLPAPEPTRWRSVRPTRSSPPTRRASAPMPRRAGWSTTLCSPALPTMTRTPAR